jgi:hypothetical protein
VNKITLCSIFSCSSLFPAAAIAQYDPPKQMTVTPTGVDLLSGRFSYEKLDLAIGPFQLTRSYLGGNTVSGSNYFGPNWTHSYAAYVSEGEYAKTDQTFVAIGRSIVRFTQYGPTAFSATSSDARGTTLQVIAGNFVYTDRQGNVYTFTSSVNAFAPYPSRRNQRVSRVDYADGHTLTYMYVGQQLRQILSNYGYSLNFEYGSNGYVSKICGYNRVALYVSDGATCGSALMTVSYEYGPAVNVSRVTDVVGQIWGYDYVDNGNISRLSCVRQVNSSSCVIFNAYQFGRPRWVTQQTTADGGIWNYNYIEPDKDDTQLPGEPPPQSEGQFTGPGNLFSGAIFKNGMIAEYNEEYPNPSTPYAVIRRRTEFTWDGLDLVTLTATEGNISGSYRDIRGNLVSETTTAKPGSGTPNVSRSTIYPESQASDCTSVVRRVCNKPIGKKDYKGNQTDYTYDPRHGGMLTESAPANALGIRATKRYGYEQRYAWIQSASGAYSPAATPIWLRTSEKTCMTSQTVGDACAAGAADEVVTTFDYGPNSGPNNLTLRGAVVTAGGSSLRTCYGYDRQGNKVSETSPRAGLAVCP